MRMLTTAGSLPLTEAKSGPHTGISLGPWAGAFVPLRSTFDT